MSSPEEQLLNFPSHLFPLHVRYQVSPDWLQWIDAVSPSVVTQAPCGTFILGQPTSEEKMWVNLIDYKHELLFVSLLRHSESVYLVIERRPESFGKHSGCFMVSRRQVR